MFRITIPTSELANLSLSIDEVATALQLDENSFVFLNANPEPLSQLIAQVLETKTIKDLKAIKAAYSSSKNLTLQRKTFRPPKEFVSLKNNCCNQCSCERPSCSHYWWARSGKTTMVQGLVSALIGLNSELKICAPTGRAAKELEKHQVWQNGSHQPFICSWRNAVRQRKMIISTL